MEVVGIITNRAEIVRYKLSDIKSLDVNITIGKKPNINKEGNLDVDFVYIANYNQDVAKIIVEGRISLSGEKSKLMVAAKLLVSGKKIHGQLFAEITSMIFTHSVTVATVLAKAIDMPAPLPKPEIKP